MINCFIAALMSLSITNFFSNAYLSSFFFDDRGLLFLGGDFDFDGDFEFLRFGDNSTSLRRGRCLWESLGECVVANSFTPIVSGSESL